jgi:uncharacterized lipoprotein YmbA
MSPINRRSLSVAAALLASVAACALPGCASAPTHFLTLVPMAGGNDGSVADLEDLQVEHVTVPSEVDQPDLVVRESDGSVALVETQRWIAPLSDEIRASLGLALARHARPPTAPATPSAPAAPSPAIRIRLEVLRFDSVPERYALLESVATLSLSGKPPTSSTCRSRLRVTVGAGYPALAQGFQTALDELAQALIRQAAALRAGTAACD